MKNRIDLQVEKAGAYDRKSAADYLSVSTRTLDQLATDGLLKRLKIGRKTLFRRIDLDEFLASLANNS